MASVASQLIEEVTAHAQNDGLEDVREMCADGTYFPNNLHSLVCESDILFVTKVTSRTSLCSQLPTTVVND